MMLVTGGHAKISEDQQENEDVVYAKRLLDQVAGQECESRLRPTPVIYAEIEEQRQYDPDAAPGQRLPDRDFVRPAMENTKVDGEHRQHEQDESHPCPRLACHLNFAPFGSTRIVTAQQRIMYLSPRMRAAEWSLGRSVSGTPGTSSIFRASPRMRATAIGSISMIMNWRITKSCRPLLGLD